jgi:long-chain acyl-CoA synthetase
MPVKWFEDFEKRYGIKIIEGYGMTEGTVASTINPRFGERKIGSIGIPMPGQDVRIFSDNDEELPPGEIGEIVIRGPNVMKEYLNRKPETEETLRNGWLHSGDLGYMDKEGYFFIVDRKKDMIIRGGENVYPKEIENLISAIPGVSEVAVVGKPDDKYGEEVVAFIVRRDETLTESKVIEFCKFNIAWYKCPKSVFFIDELPKNSVGKIQKNDLRKILGNMH